MGLKLLKVCSLKNVLLFVIVFIILIYFIYDTYFKVNEDFTSDSNNTIDIIENSFKSLSNSDLLCKNPKNTNGYEIKSPKETNLSIIEWNSPNITCSEGYIINENLKNENLKNENLKNYTKIPYALKCKKPNTEYSLHGCIKDYSKLTDDEDDEVYPSSSKQKSSSIARARYIGNRVREKDNNYSCESDADCELIESGATCMESPRPLYDKKRIGICLTKNGDILEIKPN